MKNIENWGGIGQNILVLPNFDGERASQRRERISTEGREEGGGEPISRKDNSALAERWTLTTTGEGQAHKGFGDTNREYVTEDPTVEVEDYRITQRISP